MPRRIRILLIGENSLLNLLLAESLRALGFEVIPQNSDSKKIEVKENIEAPDVGIFNVESANADSCFHSGHELRAKFPKIGLLFLSSVRDQRLLGLSHELAPQDSILLIKSELNDLAELRSLLIDAAHNRVRRGDDHHFSTKQLKFRSELTNNQVELLREISMGFSNKEIANARKVSINAIENSISRLAKKLKISQSESLNQRVTLAAIFHSQESAIH